MIRHIVMFKLKDGVGRDDPGAVAAADALTALGPTLEPVRHWETHWCFGDRPVSNQFVLICDVADEAALQAYLNDPEHRKVAAELGEYFVLSVADFSYAA
jgi:stress responsive alpha/beta barrel protein